ncbi:MAG: nucleotide exchange factor GrpE [Pseudomonadota bacterium]
MDPDDLYDEDLDTGPDERDKSKPTDPLLLLRQEITLKDAEIESLKEKLLLLQADMENLRRRTQREVGDAKAYAVSNFARDMLEVSDNLSRAVSAVPEEEAENDAVKSLVEGVQMTDRAMISAMERHGVKRLEPKGEKFDPNFHQAMFELPNTEVPHNSVVEVVQTGYSIGNRVLRPAMVGVAKGGPKFEASKPDDAGTDS